MGTIPEKILEVLGGKDFLIAAGATNIFWGADYVVFELGKCYACISKVYVRKKAGDYYWLEFVGPDGKSPQVVRGLHGSALAQEFFRITGFIPRATVIELVGKVLK